MDAEEKRDPKIELSHKLFLLQRADVAADEKASLLGDVVEAVRSDYMVPLLASLRQQQPGLMEQALGGAEKADELAKELEGKIEEEVKKLDEKIKDAEENLGESEVREAYLAKTLFFLRIGDKEKALTQIKLTEAKTVAGGQKLDLLFMELRLGFTSLDYTLIKDRIDKAHKVFDLGGGDWERKNRLKVYEGLYNVSVRNFQAASGLFLSSVSTFTSTELCSYQDFVLYTVLTGVICLGRVELKNKVVDSPEVLSVIHHTPHLTDFLQSIYNCQYHKFFQAFSGLLAVLARDRYLSVHLRYITRQVRIAAYSQFLEAYKSVTLAAMAQAFGVGEEFMDRELSNFIAEGHLHCKIDKVAGVIETTRPDRKNAQYLATLKQGDILLNRIQKLSKVFHV